MWRAFSNVGTIISNVGVFGNVEDLTFCWKKLWEEKDNKPSLFKIIAYCFIVPLSVFRKVGKGGKIVYGGTPSLTIPTLLMTDPIFNI